MAEPDATRRQGPVAAGAAHLIDLRAEGAVAERLTDEEISDIARRIARALRKPPHGDPRQDILSQQHELPPEDEDRVIRALEKLRAR